MLGFGAVWSVDLLMCGLWEEGEWREEMQERKGELLGGRQGNLFP